nr:MmcB family DNA repair protein [Euryhalocaulis caribicus]
MMDQSSAVSASNPAIDDASALMRGVARLFAERGYACVPELILANGRRADIAALGPKGELAVVEIKSGLADFRSDAKWPDYVGYCDSFYFAVSPRFPRDIIPEEAGLIVADAWGGAILREAPPRLVKPARRKAVMLRFAHCAAGRLMRG